jgi:hypothetical protein
MQSLNHFPEDNVRCWYEMNMIQCLKPISFCIIWENVKWAVLQMRPLFSVMPHNFTKCQKQPSKLLFYISICFYESWYRHIITNSILHFKVMSQQVLNSILGTISSNFIVSSITSLSDWCSFFSIIFLVNYHKWAIVASKSCCLYLFNLIHYLCISKQWHQKT